MLPAEGQSCVVFPALHRHIQVSGSPAVQIQVPAEVGLSRGHHLGDEFADQIGTGFRLGQVQNFFQSILNPAPLRLFQVDGVGLGQPFLFRAQLLQLRIQLLPQGKEFFFRDLALGSHIIRTVSA